MTLARVLHAYNLHRGGGGGDTGAMATISALRRRGIEVDTFVRDSSDIASNLGGKLRAFADGLYARQAVREFIQRIEAFRPQVVHAHELYPLISPWILPECTRRGIPVVMTVYDYRLTCPVHTHHHNGETCIRCVGGRDYQCALQNCRNNRSESVAFALRNAVARWFGLFARHVSMYIAPTRFTADWLTRYAGVSAGRISVVPFLIDIPATAVDPAAGRYMAFAGRFVPEKGVDVALSAARRARLPLWLAGNAGDYPTRVAQSENVRFVNNLNAQQLAEFYRGARLFVMPSIWFETFGIVVGESMSHGVPVLASRIGALAETTVDNVTGLLFEPGNVDELAEKMRRVWNDAELCRRLGRGGREYITRIAHPDTHVDLILTAYENVLAGS